MIVQQIVFTHAPERWWKLAEALGFTSAFPPERAWAEFHGDGILAVHEASDDFPAGSVKVTILVPDLSAAEAALVDVDVDVRRGELADVGDMLTIAAPDGGTLTVRSSVAPASHGIAVQPIWFTHDFSAPRAILEALGLRARLASDSGGWCAMRGAGGEVGLHEGTTALGLGFEATGDLAALAQRVRSAGFDVDEIDEAYAQTLRIENPDGGPRVWVNGAQSDLYGYAEL